MQSGFDFEIVDEILSVTIQMKANEQDVRTMLFVKLYKVVLTFEIVDEILSVTIQVKATEQYVRTMLFIMLYKVVLTLRLWMKF